MTKTQALARAREYGAHPSTIAQIEKATTTQQVDDLIAKDQKLADMRQDLATSWAVDVPQYHQKRRWAEYEALFAALGAGPKW